jgi:hypothetical protein
MAPPVSDNSTYNLETDKRFAASATKKLSTHYVHFMDPSEHYGFINLEPEIIGKLHITASDAFVEELVSDDVIQLRRVSKEQ